jgi:hypothetical protein
MNMFSLVESSYSTKLLFSDDKELNLIFWAKRIPILHSTAASRSQWEERAYIVVFPWLGQDSMSQKPERQATRVAKVRL